MPKGIRTTTKPSGIGRAIEKDRERRQLQPLQSKSKATGVNEKFTGKSVLDQSALEEFIAINELADAQIEVASHRVAVDEGPRIVSVGGGLRGVSTAARQAAAVNVVVPVPRKAEWDAKMSAEEVESNEGLTFLEWRRGLSKLEEHDGLIMTPYEKNLDFWRQLWRTMERSDLLVQILDSRDPMFYRSRDLENYVKELGKKHLLLVNKADFMPIELREKWRSYFAGVGVEAIFFSALRELHKMQRVPGESSITVSAETGRSELSASADDGDESLRKLAATKFEKSVTALPPHGAGLLKNEVDVLDCAQLMEELRSRLPAPADEQQRVGTVGFVGYPNVGKSSVINALFGAKKVSMSRTPGKTKHFQTLDLPDSGGLTLCDCPGLVFPSVVATSGHLVINGVVPITGLRDHMPAVRLVAEKVGVAEIQERYGITASDLKEGAERRGERDEAGSLLAGFALSRGHLLRQGVPDEAWAARKLLGEYCTGALLHCELPPSERVSISSATPTVQPKPQQTTTPTPAGGEADDSDFDDLDEFLNPDAGLIPDRRAGNKKKKSQDKKGGGAGGAKGGYAVSLS